MPIYEFVCGECGHEFEKILSFSAATPACVKCGAANVERQVGRPAIHFKGSGWYITDSKKGGSSSEKSAALPADADKGKAEKSAVSENGAGESKTGESGGEKSVSKESAPSAPAKAEAV